MSDAEYYALSFMDRMKRINELGPFWSKPLSIVQNIWVWGELIICLQIAKRRACMIYSGDDSHSFKTKEKYACGQYFTEGQAKITPRKSRQDVFLFL